MSHDRGFRMLTMSVAVTVMMALIMMMMMMVPIVMPLIMMSTAPSVLQVPVTLFSSRFFPSSKGPMPCIHKGNETENTVNAGLVHRGSCQVRLKEITEWLNKMQ